MKDNGITLPEIPPGSYILTYDDMDIGSIMGGADDPTARKASSFSEALEIIRSEKDDDMRIHVFDSHHDLVYISWELSERT